MNRDRLYAGKEVLRETLTIVTITVSIARAVFDGLALFGFKPIKHDKSSRNKDYNHPSCDDDYDELDDYNLARDVYEAYRESKSRELISRIEDARDRRRRLEGTS